MTSTRKLGRWVRWLLCAAVGGAVGVGAARPSQAQFVAMSSSLGDRWDWLYGANPLIVQPGKVTIGRIGVIGNPFNPPYYNGPAHLSVDCCKDALSGQKTALPAGVTVTLTATRQICPPVQSRLTYCPSITAAYPQGIDTTVNQGIELSFGLRVAASSTAAPGQFVATVVADTGQSTDQLDVWINVVPSALPADGPPQACTASQHVELISLQSITPNPIDWKQTHPAQTSFEIGVTLPDLTRGLDIKFVDPSTSTGPLSPGMTEITFTNNVNWPMQIRATDINCSIGSSTLTIPGNSTASFSFSAATMNSLVIANSVCPNLFSCLFGSGLGMQDVAIFSEGNFWTLFGGRRALISTVGNWKGPPPDPNQITGGP